ncbi:MAG: outer membrane protein insertion porin family [Verrucomicrobiota bacterium]
MAKQPALIHRPALSLVFLLFVALVGAVSGQEPQPQGPPIVQSIDVRFSGPAIVSKERILAQMRTRVGQPYNNQVVEQDIRALYTTGAILNVRIFAEPEAGGVKVIVAVQARSVVREIEIEGADRIGAKAIRKKIKLKINAMVNEEEMEKGRQDIIEMYQARGFTDIDVKYRVDSIDEKRGLSRVVYTINEGVRGAVRSIRFEGNTAFSDRVLRKQMKTRGKTVLAIFDKSGRLDENQLRQDLDSIREWYQNHGYIDVEVKDVRKEREKGPMIITIAVVEGIQYHVGRISITGFKSTTEEKIRKIFKMKEGTVYSPKALRDDAKALADAYGTGGYVDLEVQPSGKPSGPGRIDVSYKIEEGNRSFVQRINIVGNTRTKDKVIRREVMITPGDVYNTVRVDSTKKRLENLGYFAKVETYPEDTGVAGRKDLTIQLEEKRTGSLSFGGGFSTIDNLVAFAELSQGNFDIKDWPGFVGAGQKFRLRVQGGLQRKDFLVSLTEPWFLDRRLALSGSAFYSEANYLSAVYDQRNYGIAMELRKPLNAFMYATLGYRLEELEIFNVTTASPAIVAEEGAQLRSEILSSIVFDRRDNPLLTRRGQRISFAPYVAGGFLGGDTQIYGVDLEGSQYFHFPWDTILVLNGEAATVESWGNGNRVPIFDRLFLGGSNNLRGFAFRDVGPRDVNGEPTGGKSLARATAEFTFPVIPEKARVAVFYDTGFVNASSYDFSADNIVSDVGFGVRLVLPIGPLRIDYGIPIQHPGLGGGGRFNFNVGYQF